MTADRLRCRHCGRDIRPCTRPICSGLGPHWESNAWHTDTPGLIHCIDRPNARHEPETGADQ